MPVVMEWDWLTKTREWVHARLGDLGIRSTASPVVVKAWSRSCVLVFATDAGEVYFKAVPFYFAHEPKLLRYLADRLPASVPEVLAMDVERRWFLVRGCAGEPLSLCRCPDLWEAAIHTYAQLQLALSGNPEEVVALGCPHRPVEKLVEDANPLLSDSGAMMKGRYGLCFEEIAQLRSRDSQLESICRRLASYHIPSTLEHGDLHAANIFVSPAGCRFIDWSDSSISHPFFSLFAFLEHRKASPWLPDDPTLRARLCRAYLKPWVTTYGSWSRLVVAFRLSQLLAPLHTAITYYRLEQLNINDRTPFKKSVPYYLRLLLQRIGAVQHPTWAGGARSTLLVPASSLQQASPSC